MPQDLFTIKRYALELNNLLKGAKVNKITQPSKEEVILTLYGGKVFNLAINASAQFCRVSLVDGLKESPLVAPNFCMLLRKHLTSSTILGVETINDDRIICINFKNASEFIEEETFSLIAEVMGKYSNVFLTQNNAILGMLKTTPQTLEHKRVNLVKSKYVCPEKQDKLSACDVKNLKLCFKNYNKGDLHSHILKSFYDFSPLTAKELEHIILSQNNGVFDSDIALKTTLDFMSKQNAPVVIKNGKFNDFFSFDYTHLDGERKHFDTMLEAMNYIYSNIENSSFITSNQNALIQKVTTQEKKLIKKKDTLLKKLDEAKNAEDFKLYGELLTAYAYSIKDGQKSVTLTNYYTNENVNIALDENLNATKNAQAYYKKYSKLKSVILKTQPQLDAIEEELSYLDSIKFSITLATTKLEFDEIFEELTLNSNIKVQNSSKKQTKKMVKSNFIKYEGDNFTILVGKNNVQNDRLFKETSSLDIWFHVKNRTSCHAYILTNNKDVPIKTILTACEICAYYSKAKNEAKVEVDYTFKKHVKKQVGKGLGAVTYTNFKTLVVTPNNYEKLKKMQ